MMRIYCRVLFFQVSQGQSMQLQSLMPSCKSLSYWITQFLQLATRLSCTYILLLRSVRLFSCCSKLIQRLGNL
uniref:Uncharacterized protein n=1 Tax=Salix viminalis TaxID=40686 RepID=A0A6N2LNH0_SALVM